MRSKHFCLTGTLLCGVLLFLAACSRLPSPDTFNPSADQTYYVKPASQGGNNANNGLSIATAWATIQYAVDTAAPGDVIFVEPGTYNEQVVITKSGLPGTRTRLFAHTNNGGVSIVYQGTNKNFYEQAAIRLEAPNGQPISNWLISGFYIDGGSDPNRQNLPYLQTGILAKRGENIVLQWNTIYRTGAAGIQFKPYVTGSTVCPTYGNGSTTQEFKENTECAVQNKNISIFNNTINTSNLGTFSSPTSTASYLDQEALSLWGVDGFDVHNNTLINGGKEGIDVKVGGRNGSIYNNTITTQGQLGSSIGIYIDGERAVSSNINIYKNKIHSNKGTGIAISTEAASYNTSGATNLSGTVFDCTNGSCAGTPDVNVIYVSGINVYNNLIYDNGTPQQGKALFITNQVKNVNVYHNTFNNNFRSFQILDVGPDPLNNFPGYNGVYAKSIVLRNNIFSNHPNPGYVRNAGVSTGRVTIENNLFTGATYSNNAGTSYVTSTTWSCIPTSDPSSNSTGICGTNANKPKYNKLVTATIYILTTDPLYATDPFMLRLPDPAQNYVGSPALNAGSYTVSVATTDYLGVIRPIGPSGQRPDMGAYERP